MEEEEKSSINEGYSIATFDYLRQIDVPRIGIRCLNVFLISGENRVPKNGGYRNGISISILNITQLGFVWLFCFGGTSIL
jgi:hypothetical protein